MGTPGRSAQAAAVPTGRFTATSIAGGPARQRVKLTAANPVIAVRRGGLVLLQTTDNTQVIYVAKPSKRQEFQKNHIKSHGSSGVPDLFRDVSSAPAKHSCPAAKHAAEQTSKEALRTSNGRPAEAREHPRQC